MTDRQNISIRITDLAPIPLEIYRADEEVYRMAERHVNHMYAEYNQRYKGRSPRELMAMVAFQFAKLYFRGQSTAEKATELLKQFDTEIDALLSAQVPRLDDQPPGTSTRREGLR